MSGSAVAHLGGLWATDLIEVTEDIAVLDRGGRWAVAIPYSGQPVCARFDTWVAEEPADATGQWRGPDPAAWTSSVDEPGYLRMVEDIREAIAEGTVYQANMCRVLSAPLPDHLAGDVAGLYALLRRGNPSPHGGLLRLPSAGVAIASASPELFLSVRREGDARVVESGPIKGTGRTVADLSAKDAAENVMIVDLVRNDLSRVSATGSVAVPGLLEVQAHPGLVHLVSRVSGVLTPDADWPRILQATFPPGSVTGAPKSSALRLIDALEPAPREYYCGALGWVDADTGEAELAVAIRTFWLHDGEVRFGTGAGITWGSNPQSEWEETELKAERLIAVAAGAWQGGPS